LLILEKTLGSQCEDTKQCNDSNAVCLLSKCTCSEDYYDNNGVTMKGCCQLSKYQLTMIHQ